MKHYVDFCLSLLLIVVLLPVFLVIAGIVLLDVGSPIFFWQRRIGINGQGFHVHKFRTLKPTMTIRDEFFRPSTAYHGPARCCASFGSMNCRNY